MIEVGRVTEPVLALLHTYSPELPCLLKGAAAYAPILSKTFEGNVVKQYMELGNAQYRHFDESDLMEYGEVGHGPWCLGLPKFKVPGDRVPLDNGSDIDENPPTSILPNFGVLPDIDLTSGFAGSEGDQEVVNALLATHSGKQPEEYGALGSLLYGPVVRKGERGRMTSRHSRNASSPPPASSSAIFSVISVLTTGLLVVIMGNIGLGAGKTYEAIFTNASTLEKGDDVRVAGVSVGEVKEVEHYERTMAKVTFRIDADIELTTASTAEIRFLNLVGDRYLALEQGSQADHADILDEGDTIPVENTSPSLDLTVLFDGFKPLFQALTPDQVERAEHEPGPGAPGRGRHRPRPARAHRVADDGARRPGPADRRGGDQPQRDAGHRQPSPRAAEHPGHRAARTGCRTWRATARPSAARSTTSPT